MNDLFDELLTLVLKSTILQGDYLKVMKVCRRWAAAAKPIFFTLIPHFRDIIFHPAAVPHDTTCDIRDRNNFACGEDVFGIPRLRGNKPEVAGFRQTYMTMGIPKCIYVRKDGDSSQAYSEFELQISAPFGYTVITLKKLDCFLPMMFHEKHTNTIRITRMCGDEIAMVRLILALIPELQGVNLYQSQDCTICGWYHDIPGCSMRHNDAELGYSDSHDGHTPDMPDDGDYMYGYNNSHLGWNDIMAEMDNRRNATIRAFTQAHKRRDNGTCHGGTSWI